MSEIDFTARERDRLLAEHAEPAPAPGRNPRLHEAREKYPRATVTWDDDLNDVMVDVSSARGI